MDSKVATKDTGIDPLVINGLIASLVKTDTHPERKRADKRYPLHRKVEVGPNQSETEFHATFEAWGMDISYQGMGLVTETPMSPGQEFRVRLTLPDGRRVLIPLRVVHSSHLVGNVYRNGALFLYPE
jgi:hypothetical protein